MKKIYSVLLLMAVTLTMGACGKSADIAEKEGMVTSIHAEYPVYDMAQKLVDSADLVFSGTVENISYEMLEVRTEKGTDSITGLTEDSGIPYTIYEIKVSDVYKGNADEKTIYIKRPGGEFDGTTYALDDATAISEGENYLFLTETYENSYPSLLNASQASYNMDTPEALSEDGNNTITLSQILDIVQK